jgi:hypothetical protein
MAPEHSADISELLKSFRPSNAAFSPCAYYGDEEDALIFYFRPGRDYARRLNSVVTLYISLDDDELIGCQIKGIRSVVEDLGSFNIEVSHGRVSLSVLIMAYAATMIGDADARIAYRQIAQAASDAKLEVELV